MTVEATFLIIKNTLKGGEDIPSSGIGKFYPKDKGKLGSGNPQTSEDLMLADRRIVTFKCSRVQREKLNDRQG